MASASFFSRSVPILELLGSVSDPYSVWIVHSCLASQSSIILPGTTTGYLRCNIVFRSWCEIECRRQINSRIKKQSYPVVRTHLRGSFWQETCAPDPLTQNKYTSHKPQATKPYILSCKGRAIAGEVEGHERCGDIFRSESWEGRFLKMI